MIRKRLVLAITAATAAVATALGAPLASQAEQYNQNQPWGCAWSDGPTIASTGCTYTDAFDSVGSVEWVGGTTQATVTGATDMPICAFVGNVGGVCVYTQTIGSTVSVTESSATAGVAGAPQAAGVTVEPFECVWAPLTGGCSYQVTVAGPAMQGTVVYAGGPAPTISGSNPTTSVTSVSCTPSTAISGTCTYTFTPPGTVIVTANSLSAGLAISPGAPL